jgi:hypothetical protein
MKPNKSELQFIMGATQASEEDINQVFAQQGDVDSTIDKILAMGALFFSRAQRRERPQSIRRKRARKGISGPARPAADARCRRSAIQYRPLLVRASRWGRPGFPRTRFSNCSPLLSSPLFSSPLLLFRKLSPHHTRQPPSTRSARRRSASR